MVDFLGFGVLREPYIGQPVEARPGVNTAAATEPDRGHAAGGVRGAVLCSGRDGLSQPIRSPKFPVRFIAGLWIGATFTLAVRTEPLGRRFSLPSKLPDSRQVHKRVRSAP